MLLNKLRAKYHIRFVQGKREVLHIEDNVIDGERIPLWVDVNDLNTLKIQISVNGHEWYDFHAAKESEDFDVKCHLISRVELAIIY